MWTSVQKKCASFRVWKPSDGIVGCFAYVSEVVGSGRVCVYAVVTTIVSLGSSNLVVLDQDHTVLSDKCPT